MARGCEGLGSLQPAHIHWVVWGSAGSSPPEFGACNAEVTSPATTQVEVTPRGQEPHGLCAQGPQHHRGGSACPALGGGRQAGGFIRGVCGRLEAHAWQTESLANGEASHALDVPGEESSQRRGDGTGVHSGSGRPSLRSTLFTGQVPLPSSASVSPCKE